MHRERNEKKKNVELCGAFAHIWNDVNKTHFTFHGTGDRNVRNHAKGKHSCYADRVCAFFFFKLFLQSSDFGHIASAYQLISVHHSIITCKYCTHSMVDFTINRRTLCLSDAVSCNITETNMYKHM